LKVLLVSNGFPPSGQWGTEYYTHQLAMGLVARGDEVLVLHPSRDPSRERFSLREVEREGIRVFELANTGDPRKRFADSYICEGVERVFEALLQREVPDVVHFTHLLWGLSVRLPAIARAHGARSVVTLTDFGLLCHRGQLYDWLEQECDGAATPAQCARCVREPGRWDYEPLSRKTRHLAVSAMASCGGLGRVVVAEDIRRREARIRAATAAVDHWILPTRTLAKTFFDWGLDERSSTILPYGIDESRYAAERGPRAKDGVRFVYMSQYMPHKGLASLLEAARLLEERLPESVEPWRVDLHGNGSADRHRLYAREMLGERLPRRVHECGPFEPMRAPEILDRADCVMVPSRWRENAPLTILQARAAGVPVIASDVPGVREVLEPGVHGLLFPPGDSSAMAEAMSQVILGQFAGVRPAPLVLWETHLAAVCRIHAGEAEPALPFDLPTPTSASTHQPASRVV